MEYKVIYDETTSGIRMLQLDIEGHKVVFTHNSKHKDTHVKIKQTNFMAPELMYLKGDFVFTYGHIVIFPEQRSEFLQICQDCIAFCSDVKPFVENVIEKLNKGEPL